MTRDSGLDPVPRFSDGFYGKHQPSPPKSSWWINVPPECFRAVAKARAEDAGWTLSVNGPKVVYPEPQQRKRVA